MEPVYRGKNEASQLVQKVVGGQGGAQEELVPFVRPNYFIHRFSRYSA